MTDQTEGTAVAIVADLKNIPHWLVPNSLADVEKLAAKMCVARWVPKSYLGRDGEPDRAKVELAIMHGATVGIPAIMAAQVIAVINGMPSIFGDGMLGLVMSSGLLEDFKEDIQGSGDEVTATCLAKRKGVPTPAIAKFSIAMAKRAGLWTKEGPWHNYPARMLQMRARALALRDRFPDVLKGLRMAEEVLDEMVDVTPRSDVPADRPKQADYDMTTGVVIDLPASDQAPIPEPVAEKTKPTRQKKAEAAPVPPPPPAEPEPTGDDNWTPAFVLKAWDGQEFEFRLESEFPQAADEMMREAFKNAGVNGIDGFIESNAGTFSSMAPSVTVPLTKLADDLRISAKQKLGAPKDQTDFF